MTTTNLDDETLMAFADGELDEVAAAEVAAAIDADPALAARVEMFMETRALARSAFAPMLGAPVPPALREAVEAGMTTPSQQGPEVEPPVARVIPFRARTRTAPPRASRPTQQQSGRRLSLPAAACIAIVAAGAAGYLAGKGFGPEAPARIALVEAPGLDNALSSVASGETVELAGGSQFRAVSSFRDPQQRLCREFELAGGSEAYVAVACRQETEWNVAFAVSTPAAEGGYQPASSLETLDSFLSSMGAGPPLSGEDEAAALAD
jgi:anti-sigma factor RsiW